MVFEIDITNAKGLSFGLCSPEKMEGGAAKHRRYHIKMHAVDLYYEIRMDFTTTDIVFVSNSSL